MLPITVNTEPGEVLSGITAEELATVIGRLGGKDDRFAVVERTSGDADYYIQTWHERGGAYEVEYRDGSQERHFAARLADAEAVVAVFVGWALETDGWADGHDWKQVDFSSEVEDGEDAPDIDATEGFDDEADARAADALDPELREEAEEHAGVLVRGGFELPGEIAEAVSDYFYEDGGTPVSVAAARGIVGPLWRERLAEQATWPEVTDPDRVGTAFDALAERGITARMNFTCCGNCGLAEIGAEAAEGDRGFVFFHYQDTERAVEGGALCLRYGVHHGTGEGDGSGGKGDTASIGREVAAALVEAGLGVVWDGDPGQAIEVDPLDWRKRLPTY
ncbi:DUF6891 domain-containing protein [Streptomyces netropsis]|uniref:DUF6891 domain-containing protein n=1 Tax=Streptomyces netropsis TaxID=55404 RepID=A0A7W7L6Y6_STRNE|nr:hypothetical protein [Streptomyces netropsis]MBB4884624.1 hypothetical protein [Streptomyces netropsis]GGR02381.1 hypothetical protein GCM10010219_02840 [Streptomyces netropsis]